MHVSACMNMQGLMNVVSLCCRYKSIEEVLSQSCVYSEPLFLNDFAPIHPRLRYNYIHELSLPFPVELYSYSYGNNLGTLWYAWKVPYDSSERDVNKSKQLMRVIDSNVKVYHTREMRRQFVSRYGLVCEAKQSVLVNMYQFLTGDGSATSISKDVMERLEFMLDSQDPDVVFDLRVNNPGRPEVYSEFWSRVRELINEHSLKAVDDRRHGHICHMAVAFSVNDLREQIVSKYPDINAPSVEWIRCQFWPRNPFRQSASHYSAQFAIKFMVQSRQVNADHVDSHYCAAIFKYLRELAIMFRSHTSR